VRRRKPRNRPDCVANDSVASFSIVFYLVLSCCIVFLDVFTCSLVFYPVLGCSCTSRCINIHPSPAPVDRCRCTRFFRSARQNCRFGTRVPGGLPGVIKLLRSPPPSHRWCRSVPTRDESLCFVASRHILARILLFCLSGGQSVYHGLSRAPHQTPPAAFLHICCMHKKPARFRAGSFVSPQLRMIIRLPDSYRFSPARKSRIPPPRKSTAPPTSARSPIT